MQTQITNIGTFPQGLNTEVSQLTDNPQYTTDELNCQIFKDLTRARRYGINIEEDGTAISGYNIATEAEITYQPVWNTNALTDDQDKLKITAKYTTAGTYTFKITEAGQYYVILIGAGGGGQGRGKKASMWSGGGAGGEIGVVVTLSAGTYTVVVGAGGAGGAGYSKHWQLAGSPGGDTYLKNSSGTVLLKAGGGQASGHRSTPTDSDGGTVSINMTTSTTLRSATGNKGLNGNKGGTGGKGTLSTSYGSGGNCNPNASPSYPGKSGLFMIRKVSSTNTVVYEVPLTGISGYYWSNYDKKGSDCVVVQQGKLLHFYEATAPYSTHKITTLNFSGLYTSVDESELVLNYASGEGYLVCVSPLVRPFYVTLKDGKASTQVIDLKVRDLEGLEESLAIDEQPTSLTAVHKYNLLNQGWTTDKITTFFNSQSKYPSNNLQWFIGRNTSGDFSVSDLLKYHFGTCAAPKGLYILDYFNKDRSSVSSVSGLTTETTGGYVVDTLFSTGRFFYLVGNTVLFSQNLLQNISNIGKCYQDADPTSEEISDIVATDGGTILFQNIGKGVGIVRFPTGLLVFGKDGVYDIASSTGTGFDATDYTTDFVTNAGAYNKTSIIQAESNVYYWSPTGIYKISVDEITGTRAVAENISLNTIQTWYNALPKFSKENAKGVFDYVNNRIVWCYPTNEDEPWRLDGTLKLELSLNAFLPGKLAEGGGIIYPIRLRDPVKVLPSTGLYANEDAIYADTKAVTASEYTGEYDLQSCVSYLILVDYYLQFYFGDFSSRDFIDWEQNGYSSYFVSGPVCFGSTYKRKYAPEIQMYFKKTEEKLLKNNNYLAPSGCKVRARWRWSNNADSNRWDIEQQGYITGPLFMNFRYVNGKMRVRGNGEALQLSITSEDTKDFRLSGMNVVIRS